VYVLVRNDLPSLNPGKAMSQCHHAGVQMVSKHFNNQLVNDYLADGKPNGADSFNTTLVMAANYNQIVDTINKASQWSSDTIDYGMVVDPSYPFVVDEEISRLIPQTNTTKIVKVLDNGKVLMVREELTCAWVLIDRNYVSARSLFDGLNLHP